MVFHWNNNFSSNLFVLANFITSSFVVPIPGVRCCEPVHVDCPILARVNIKLIN
jgi:hypothetical protein